MINATTGVEKKNIVNQGVYQRPFHRNSSNESIFLEEKFEEIKDKQGFIGNAWNEVKELTSFGVSEIDCKDMLRKYNNGEISFEEAVNYLDEFDAKQKSMSNLLSNIATGAASIAIATPLGLAGATGAKTISWALAFAKGAPIGAVLKTSINALDRGSNNIEGDALDAKQMAKDAISGAITGTTSAVSGASSIGYKSLVDNGLITEGTLVASTVKGAMCGMQCGALSGSANYMTDVAFQDKEFDFGELTKTTLTSAAVSGTVGGVVGSSVYGLDKLGTQKTVTEMGQIFKDTITSSTRKLLGFEVSEALNT